jgi:hypothetical protein
MFPVWSRSTLSGIDKVKVLDKVAAGSAAFQQHTHSVSCMLDALGLPTLVARCLVAARLGDWLPRLRYPSAA